MHRFLFRCIRWVGFRVWVIDGNSVEWAQAFCGSPSCSEMVKFIKAKAVAAAPRVGNAGQEAPVRPLKDLVEMDPLPLGGVSCVGRVIREFCGSSRHLALAWKRGVCGQRESCVFGYLRGRN